MMECSGSNSLVLHLLCFVLLQFLIICWWFLVLAIVFTFNIFIYWSLRLGTYFTHFSFFVEFFLVQNVYERTSSGKTSHCMDWIRKGTDWWGIFCDFGLKSMCLQKDNWLTFCFCISFFVEILNVCAFYIRILEINLNSIS